MDSDYVLNIKFKVKFNGVTRTMKGAKILFVLKDSDERYVFIMFVLIYRFCRTIEVTVEDGEYKFKMVGVRTAKSGSNIKDVYCIEEFDLDANKFNNVFDD